MAFFICKNPTYQRQKSIICNPTNQLWNFITFYFFKILVMNLFKDCRQPFSIIWMKFSYDFFNWNSIRLNNTWNEKQFETKFSIKRNTLYYIYSITLMITWINENFHAFFSSKCMYINKILILIFIDKILFVENYNPKQSNILKRDY